MDGGRSWLILALCFLTQFISHGLFFASGIINTALLEAFDASKGLTAVPTATMGALNLLANLPAAMVDNRCGQRATLFAGGLITSFGLVLSAFASSIIWLIPSLGVMCGVGLALSYLPSMTILPFYFERHLTVAYGITCAGGSVGLLLLSFFVTWAVYEYSWRGMLLLVAGLSLHSCAIALLLSKPRTNSSQHGLANSTEELQAKQHQTKCTSDASHICDAFNKDVSKKESRLDKFDLFAKVNIQRSSSDNCRLHEISLDDCTRSATRHNPYASVLNGDVHTSDVALHQYNMSNGTLSTGTLEVKRALYPDLNRVTLTKCVLNSSVNSIHLGASQCLQPIPGAANNGHRHRRAVVVFHWDIFRNATYLLQLTSAFFRSASRSIVYIFVTAYALHRGFNMQQASLLMTVLAIANLIMRPLSGVLATKFGILHQLWVMSSIVSTPLICLFVLCGAQQMALFILVFLFGLAEAAYEGLWGGILIEALGAQKLGSGLGALCFVYGISNLVAPPLAGLLIDVTGGYDGAFFLAGSLSALAGVLSLLSVLVFRPVDDPESIADDIL